MKMELRALNDSGEAEFLGFLARLRAREDVQVPRSMLDSDDWSNVVHQGVHLEDRSFISRYELGEYLVGAMRTVSASLIARTPGVWSWLALLYFDQLCPADSNGIRDPRATYTYILSRDYRHYPRHAIRTTYMLVQKYGDTVRFMLSKPLHKRGEIAEQILARQDFADCPAVIQAANILYNDEDRGTFKTGAAGRGKGSVTRFITVLQQFQLTYDLFSMAGSDLVSLLPSEFNRFR